MMHGCGGELRGGEFWGVSLLHTAEDQAIKAPGKPSLGAGGKCGLGQGLRGQPRAAWYNIRPHNKCEDQA